MDEMVITSEKNLFNHAIDRRVYSVGQDIRAKSGTASEILQNIPSVQVDIDGNVSLRGSSDVMILINGKKSPLMGRSRADVLQQLPAGSIDKIEVITNPSARFTPEGTSGIINIVMKKGAGPGMNGDVTGHLGTSGRHNENLAFGYATGTLNLFGNYSYRDDRRRRSGMDARTLTTSGPISSYREDNQILMRPLVHVGSLGLTYHWDPKNTLDLSSTYFYRRPSRDGVSTVVTRTSPAPFSPTTTGDRQATNRSGKQESPPPSSTTTPRKITSSGSRPTLPMTLRRRRFTSRTRGAPPPSPIWRAIFYFGSRRGRATSTSTTPTP